MSSIFPTVSYLCITDHRYTPNTLSVGVHQSIALTTTPIGSAEYIDSCMAAFDKLDVNKNHSLDTAELAPMIVDLVGSLVFDGDIQVIDPTLEECLAFVSAFFDQVGLGSLVRYLGVLIWHNQGAQLTQNMSEIPSES